MNIKATVLAWALLGAGVVAQAQTSSMPIQAGEAAASPRAWGIKTKEQRDMERQAELDAKAHRKMGKHERAEAREAASRKGSWGETGGSGMGAPMGAPK